MKPKESQADEAGAELIEAVKAGDERAFEELYHQLAPMLFGLVFRILGDAKEAEDILQEGFLHIWRKAGTYDRNRSNPSTWAVMIFQHKAIDRLRSRQRRARGVERLAAEYISEPGGDGYSDQQAAKNEQSGVIRAALAKIPEEQRSAIRLAFFSGLTQTEIAARLGAPLGTVKARIRRGLLLLAELLEGKI